VLSGRVFATCSAAIYPALTSGKIVELSFRDIVAMAVRSRNITFPLIGVLAI
jgi:hypothetical protein